MQKIEFIKCETLHGSTPSNIYNQRSNTIEMEEKKLSHTLPQMYIIYVCMVAIWRLHCKTHICSFLFHLFIPIPLAFHLSFIYNAVSTNLPYLPSYTIDDVCL